MSDKLYQVSTKELVEFIKNKKAIIPMILFSLILGAGIGLAGAKFIG